MTFEEHQEHLILKRLVHGKRGLLSKEEYEQLVKDITGNSHDFIKNSLINKGYLQERYDYVDRSTSTTYYGCRITDLGKKAYDSLNKKKRTAIVNLIVFWVTLAAAVISAIYGVLSYYAADDAKQRPLPKEHKEQVQPKQDTLLLKPDTTKGRKQ